jgi:uncharacterized SAM-binding protein YcdF (DUF218 family)
VTHPDPRPDRRRLFPPRPGWGLLGLALGALCYRTLVELGASRLIGPAATGMAWWAAGGALLGVTRWRVIPPVLAGLCGGTLLLVAQTRLIEGPARRLVRQDSLPTGPVSAIVVLSGSLTPTGLLEVSAADRLLQGLQLLRAGVAPRLVVSRVQVEGPGGLRLDSDRDQQRFLHLLSPEPRVAVIPARSTRDEAEGVAALARAEGWGPVIVVTSPLHSRRACAAFEASGVRVVCYPCLDREYGLQRMTPGERIRAFRDWVYETAGWYSYRRRGWV